MGINERREKEKEIRRNDIIEAAERVFFSKGYDAATMDDVAKEAEFSKRTVYVYFSSKEQIYFEIMIKGYRLLIGMLDADMKKLKTDDPIGTIRQMAVTQYNFSREYPDYFNAIMEYENSELDFQKGVSDASKEECYSLGEKVFGYLTGALKKGIEKGVFRSDLDEEKTALVLWSCMLGVFNTVKRKEKYILNYHNTSADELISTASAFLLRSIVKDGGNDL